MDFMGIGILELFIILFLVLLVFGPDKMLEVARTAGKYVRKFRAITTELNRQINAELDRETTEVRNDLRNFSDDLSSEVKGISESLTSEQLPPVNSRPEPNREIDDNETTSKAGGADG